jgi:geranylgeranyl diphosphate synthase, type II
MMTARDLDTALRTERLAVDRRLRLLMRKTRGVPERLRAAMSHSLFSGGKRLRPVLMLWTYDALRSRRAIPRDAVLDAACTLEMIHTYSLIHDDLPAMDDDVLRRGQPTCHVAFDEATAILAGDGLLTLALAILARTPRHGAMLVALVAEAAGPAGMVGGQQVDLDAEGVVPDAALVRRIHRDKTARLIAAAMSAGAVAAGRDESGVAAIDKAGLRLGLAFQAADDLLDVEGDAARLGKSVGKDAAADKATWVRLEGLDKARKRTRRYGREGERLLSDCLASGEPVDRLLDLGRRLWDRDR